MSEEIMIIEGEENEEAREVVFEEALEAILFAAGEPVAVERICLTLEADKATVEAVCQRLAEQKNALSAYIFRIFKVIK